MPELAANAAGFEEIGGYRGIAARSLGMGSCWVYFGQLPLDDQDVRNALEMQEGEKVFGPILLGHPKGGEFPAPPPKKEPVISGSSREKL